MIKAVFTPMIYVLSQLSHPEQMKFLIDINRIY